MPGSPVCSNAASRSRGESTHGAGARLQKKHGAPAAAAHRATAVDAAGAASGQQQEIICARTAGCSAKPCQLASLRLLQGVTSRMRCPA